MSASEASATVSGIDFSSDPRRDHDAGGLSAELAGNALMLHHRDGWRTTEDRR